MNQNKFSDSAGVPWQGRSFDSNRFSHDDGETPKKIALALESHAKAPNLLLLVDSLRGERLLIPLLATLGESELGPHGHKVDKSADLAIVAVATPDKQTAIPVFTSVSDMAAWNQEARPVPVESERVAIAAISEGHTRIILNPATDAIAIRRPALEAIAKEQPWLLPHTNEKVSLLISEAIANASEVQSFELSEGDAQGKLLATELKIKLTLAPGLDAQRLSDLLTEIGSRLRTEEFLGLVDSISFQLLAS